MHVLVSEFCCLENFLVVKMNKVIYSKSYSVIYFWAYYLISYIFIQHVWKMVLMAYRISINNFQQLFHNYLLLFLSFSLKPMHESYHYCYYLLYCNKHAMRVKQNMCKMQSIFILHSSERKLAGLSLKDNPSGIYFQLLWMAPDRTIKYSFAYGSHGQLVP